MGLGRVAQIYRYPVKSMGGESLDRVELGDGGLPGDRAWAVLDGGAISGGKKIGGLMHCRARYLETPPASGSGPAQIELPDGAHVSTGASDASERISAAVGREVVLSPLRPADDLDHYRRRPPESGDFEKEMRAVFARSDDEPLPDITRFPREVLMYESPPGSYFEAFPLLLLTESSLAYKQKRAPTSRFDVRRFRPNFLIEGADDEAPFPELAWRDKSVRIGEAIVRVTIECPRCVMITRGFDDLPKDPKIMRAVVREAQGNLGVYATVERPGAVAIGDPVELA